MATQRDSVSQHKNKKKKTFKTIFDTKIFTAY